MYPVIGAYEIGDKVRIKIDGVLREGEIICIGLNGYVVASNARVYIVNDPQIKWCARTSGESEPKEEVVRYDSDTAIGLAALNKAFELQRKYCNLENEIVRLHDLMTAASNGHRLIFLRFDNKLLGRIANMIYADFRPITEEDKKQMYIDAKNFVEYNKKK